MVPQIKRFGRWPKRLRSAAMPASAAPVARKTPNAPPIRKTKKMISSAPAKPSGIAMNSAHGFGRSGAGRVSKVPATTTSRPFSLVCRWYSPCGSR